jgi:glycosyltransferase involved in cell wall biosynthesis
MISAVILLGNDRKYIGGCIESVVGRVDEVIVVNSGSEEVGWDYDNVRVLDREWNGSFSDARNWGIERCSGDWVMMIDDDERLGIGNIELGLAKGYEVKLEGWQRVVRYRGGIEDMGNIWFEDYQVRLFRNEGFRYVNKLHEMISMDIISRGYDIGRSDLVFHHLGYDIGKEEIFGKMMRNVGVAISGVIEDNDGVSWYNLGISYVNIDRDRALECFRKAQSYGFMGKLESRINCFYGSSERDKGNLVKALEYYEKGLRIDRSNEMAIVGKEVVSFELGKSNRLGELMKDKRYSSIISINRK